MTSIRRNLLVWLLSSVLAGGIGAAAVVFFQARVEVNDIFDYQLRQLALTLRDRTYFPNDFADALKGEESLEVVIQVWASDGTLLYVAPGNVSVPNAVQLGFGQVAAASGVRWRTFATQQRGLTIQVAQPLSVRNRLAFTAAWRTLLPFVIALPLMGLLIWRLVGRELRPIVTATQAVARRSPQSLQPIESEDVPVEIEPLVSALNGLLGRLSSALEHERQFIADAAHELRTPLTALRLQLQLAERARNDDERARSHAALREGIARAVRLVEQLLALARQDPDAPVEAREVDLVPAARSAIDGHAATAEAHGLSLGLEAQPGESVPVHGDAASLRTLLDNLLDNAIRYTPAGRIDVRVAREGDRAILEVEDTGPGIPAAERARVFDRFYRGEGAAQGGSGLGLAIVKRIADKHGGAVELLDTRSGRGLRVRVSLPLKPGTHPEFAG
jgi:two-component system OmpR family sensor kinase